MSIEYANLEELCHIKTGAPMARARKIPEGGEARSVRALPPRSLQGGSIVDDELVTEEVGEINKEHFTREGDVVIKLSTPYDSAYIDKDHEGILVTSSAMILRKKPDAAVDMQYLSMFLGMPQTNAVLQAVSTGQSTAMAMLKRRAVAEIEVPLPTLERQQELALLFQAVQERRRQYTRLIELDEELIVSQMSDSIWGEGR